MKAQATRNHGPSESNTSRGELIGCLLIAVTFAAGLAIFHRVMWAVFA